MTASSIRSAIALSPHFTVGELCKSETASRLGINQDPPTDVLRNLARLAIELEKVRHALGDAPLVIHSGYRSPILNAKVGGATNSYHLMGLAADFDPPAGWTHDAAQHALALLTDLDYDLILEESARDGAHWLHFQIPRPGATGRRLIRDAQLDHQGGAITRTVAG